MKSAITVSLVPEAKGGPFVFWDNLQEAGRTARSLGFDAIEIFPRSPEDLDRAKIEPLLAETGLKIAAVGTGAGWVVHKLRLTDPDAAVRLKAREFLNRIVRAAAHYDAPAIIGSMQGRSDPPVGRDQALDWLKEALEPAALLAQDSGVNLLLEPLNRYETNLLNNVKDSVAFLHTIGPRNVKLLCDLFHMNIEEASIPAALKLAGPLVGHVHFADSNRLAIGFGHTDVKPIIAALKETGYDGYFSAEILPLPNSMLAAEQTIESFKKFTR